MSMFLEQVICRRCGYVWEPRIAPEKIKCCPNCKSRKWREEKAQ